MSKKDGKDTILSLYTDIVNEIKSNEEVVGTVEGNFFLRKYKAELKNALKSKLLKGKSESERLSFTTDTRNQIERLSGRDYYFTVDDGFKSYTMKKSIIEKKGDKTAAYMLKKFKEHVIDAANKIKKDKKYNDNYKRKMSGAYKKLLKNVGQNLGKLKRKQDYDYDDYYDNIINRKAYPIFQNINLTNISINI